MVYIAKLARRLARLWAFDSTHLPSMVSLLLIAACAAGEPTGISSISLPDLPDAPVVVSPRRMTLEGNQQVLFRAYESDLTTQVTSIEWTTSGGSIGGDGSYSSSATGDFRVIGKRVGNPHNIPDTSTVTVVPVQTTLTGVVVSPSAASVVGGQQQQYTAAGLMSDGSTVAIGVTWSATGGTIDVGGLFTAGNTAGTFQVIATHVTTGIADTVPVSVLAVKSTAMNPTSASVSTGGTQQFSVKGTLSDGSTVTLTTMGYAATGGTISASGLYTAPLTSGTYKVIARLSGASLADTSTVTVPSTTSALTFSGPWHEPSGLTRIFDSPFTAPLSTTANNSEGWRTGVGNASYVSTIDATPPVSPSKVVQILYPSGFTGGVDNTHVIYSAQYGSVFPAQNTGYLYQRITLKVDPNWSDGGNTGTKFSFFKKEGSTINHFINLTEKDMPMINVGTQGTGDDQYWRGPTYTKGAWHTIEIFVTPGTPGVSNGTLRGWLDGAPITWYRASTGETSTQPSDIRFFPAGDTPKYDKIYFAGTYGGGTNPVPHTQYVWFDNWYASAR